MVRNLRIVKYIVENVSRKKYIKSKYCKKLKVLSKMQVFYILTILQYIQNYYTYNMSIFAIPTYYILNNFTISTNLRILKFYNSYNTNYLTIFTIYTIFITCRIYNFTILTNLRILKFLQF